MRTGTPTRDSFGRLGLLLPWLRGQAYPLLVLTTLIWGANAVAARLAVGEVSPMMLTCARWGVSCIALGLSSRREIATHWSGLRGAWPFIFLMGALGFTGFNALFYAAAHHTTAVNIAIIQGSIPVLVLLGSVMLYRTRVGPVQFAGVAITVAGIAVVACQGQLARLAQLSFNVGDVWITLACLLYAGYALGLRRRPPVPAIVFFAATALVACLVSLPLLAAEIAMGNFIVPTAKGFALIAFVGLLPSFVSQMTFIRAVELIGPARAGVFLNLVPIFGPLLAVLVLGEALSLYHGVALALVLGGIYIAEKFGRREQ
ncbi:MAG: DMT family transporter [Gammaproteobacteria bacterium]|nr:DMT family transporter [Gammaproteobacteria bacterium]MBU1530563.1 DMT family transporter [Gammaproteobacteria bacterium]MBU2285298.1 DMT family transporter [Gammaproteobacteria bacterium]MBU2408758.1 DMT family transporter [Gammaproteobacteria bacterium]